MDELLAAIANAGIPAPCFEAGDVDSIPDAGGAYALALRLERPLDVALRGAGPARLRPGWLVYAGSANGPGGLRARLRRHFRQDKVPHWHVDRLTVAAARIAALPVVGGGECGLVGLMLRSPGFEVALAGFGNTDCRACETHLLRFAPSR